MFFNALSIQRSEREVKCMEHEFCKGLSRSYLSISTTAQGGKGYQPHVTEQHSGFQRLWAPNHTTVTTENPKFSLAPNDLSQDPIMTNCSKALYPKQISKQNESENILALLLCYYNLTTEGGKETDAVWFHILCNSTFLKSQTTKCLKDMTFMMLYNALLPGSELSIL